MSGSNGHASVVTRSHRGAVVTLLSLVLVLALAGVAVAGSKRFGSSLGAAASQAYPHPVDTVFWARHGAPAKGRVAAIKVKGCAVKAGGKAPLTQVHFQSLRPAGGSAARVVLTAGPFSLPVCGSAAGPTTVTSFNPGNLCVHKGDFVGFNDSGGFGPGYPQGVSYRVLGRVAGASTLTFTGAGHTNNGNVVSGHTLGGVELLMRMTVATGRAAGVCASF